MIKYNYKPEKGVAMQCPVLNNGVSVGSETCMKDCKKWEMFDQKDKQISCKALSDKLNSDYQKLQ